jgi:hypothetical protein
MQTRIRFRSPMYLLIQIFVIYKKSYSALFPTSHGLQASGGNLALQKLNLFTYFFFFLATVSSFLLPDPDS